MRRNPMYQGIPHLHNSSCHVCHRIGVGNPSPREADSRLESMGKRETADKQRGERVCRLSLVGDGFPTLVFTQSTVHSINMMLVTSVLKTNTSMNIRFSLTFYCPFKNRICIVRVMVRFHPVPSPHVSDFSNRQRSQRHVERDARGSAPHLVLT